MVHSFLIGNLSFDINLFVDFKFRKRSIAESNSAELEKWGGLLV